MITIITGTPGAGKTLFGIQKLVLPLLGTTIERTDDNGHKLKTTRKIYTNINGALFDHELVGPGGKWLPAKGEKRNFYRVDTDEGEDVEVDPAEDDEGADVAAIEEGWSFAPAGVGRGLRDWYKWAEPGSVIVYDEFQRVWKPRPNGSAVPPDIQMLDTHRHLGVDFVLITQSPNNHDRHIHGLGARHLHIRRLGNMPLATVYEWDHVSKSLMFSKAFTKRPFRYSSKIYKLYKSADAHTKQPRSIPSMVWILLGALALAAYAMPNAYSRISTRLSDGIEGKTALSSSSKVTSSTTTITQGPPPGMVLPGQTGDKAAPGADAINVDQVEAPTINGCISIASKCKCFTSSGVELDQDEQLCKSLQEHQAPGAIGRLAAERNYFMPPPAPPALHF